MYNHKEIEPKWQQYWEANKTFKTELNQDKPKYYILDMFPYPSGAGLHVGHPEGYTATDIVSRYKRMNGFNVLHPLGWDAFGLPAENYAIKTGIHPRKATEDNIATFKRQIQSIGFSYDWDREIDTTDPDYYKWTQWMFLQFFKKDMAYKKNMAINWCLSCKIGLANEEVLNGKCERCGGDIEKRDKEQWMIAITKYAERLVEGLEEIDFPPQIEKMQRNWIGKSEGITIKQKIKDLDIDVEVFDSVPQTFAAQTFAVVAPEHPLLKKMVEGTEYEEAVMAKAKEIIHHKETHKYEDQDLYIDGIFTGRYMDNPYGTGDLPIWVASFVIADYGSGFVNCSAHDERDFVFAKKFDIPLRPVMFPPDPVEAEKVRNLEYCYHHADDGVLEAPEAFKGRAWGEARMDVIEYLEKEGLGERSVQYKLRDWVFSRQRYWGEPIPLVKCEKGCGKDGWVPVPDEELPLQLPNVEKYEPTDTGDSPLAAIEEWVNTTCPECGGDAKRETDTMPNWAGSSWYFWRYMDPNNDEVFASKEALEYFGQVDMYVGGAEHAVLHLLYARFWNHFFYDLGLAPHKEPFYSLRNQGMILGTDGQKMSKSKGNVINPDDIIEDFGADTLRMYEMFMGPFEQVKPWDMKGVEGIYRFLHRVWNVFDNVDEAGATGEIETLMHKTIKKVGEDIEEFRFNTAISQMMIFVNALMKLEAKPKNALENLVLVLSPFAPHICEELWSKLGHEGSLSYIDWPQYDEDKTVDDEVEIVVQVNGKLRDKFMAPVDIEKEDALAKAKETDGAVKHMEGKEIVKEIYVPGKLVNLVVK